MKRSYGWKKNPEGLQLKKFSESKFFKVMDLPHLVDLRPIDSPILDQGELGSCTANGIGGCINFIQKGFLASRLFIYWNERNAEGTVDQDSGANISDGIASVQSLGVCEESEWPYDPTQFTVQPPGKCYDDALKDVVTDYLALESDIEIKTCLASGFPVVFGITLFESFESQEVATTGIVPIPGENEQELGGHCMKIVGYDDENKWWIVANSWGTGWGASGYCFIPYSVMDFDGADYGTVRKDTGK